MTFTGAAVTPEKRRQRNAKTPWPGKIFSLDSENLMLARAATGVGSSRWLTATPQTAGDQAFEPANVAQQGLGRPAGTQTGILRGARKKWLPKRSRPHLWRSLTARVSSN